MKPDKRIHIKFESMGQPTVTAVHNDITVIQALKEAAHWLFNKAVIQRRIVITIGANAEDLETKTDSKLNGKAAAMAELDAMFAEVENGLGPIES